MEARLNYYVVCYGRIGSLRNQMELKSLVDFRNWKRDVMRRMKLSKSTEILSGKFKMGLKMGSI